MKYILFHFSFIFAIKAMAMPADSIPAAKAFNQSFIPANAFVFYVIGDWGRKGKYHQTAVAASMNKCASIVPPKFIVSTGDNFYTFGVSGAKDKAWQQSYENIYNGPAIRETDWYPVLGNHDMLGDKKAEIEYSKINPHWKMPAQYYAAKFKTADNERIDFVFTNSGPLEHCKSKEQWKWIDSTLAASNSAWKFVVGHHPVYSSNNGHGNSPKLIAKLKPELEKYGVQAYFCGHDHDLQHQQPKGSKVDYFVSGAGSELRPSASDEHTLFAKSAAGFLMVAIAGNTMLVYFIDENANVIYQYSRIK